ncbi:complex I NDUFA9 subunit family protein [Marinobacteraceae bacterium S3BR75-40.1]
MEAHKVLVLGGTGFLGGHVVEALAVAGHTVRLGCRHPERPALETDHPVDTVSCDIRDIDSLRKAVAGCDAVVNAVSLYEEKGGLTFEAIHVAGARQLAEVARGAGVGCLVQLSGIGADTTSDSKYVRARAQGEKAVQSAFPEAVILRPSVLFDDEGGFVEALEWVSRLPLIPLFGNGTTRLQPVHAADVAVAIERLVARSGSVGRLFELGGARACSYREWLELMLLARGRRRLMLPVPFAIWRLIGSLARWLPGTPVTRDQVILMERDNVADPELDGFRALAIRPRSLESVLR